MTRGPNTPPALHAGPEPDQEGWLRAHKYKLLGIAAGLATLTLVGGYGIAYIVNEGNNPPAASSPEHDNTIPTAGISPETSPTPETTFTTIPAETTAIDTTPSVEATTESPAAEPTEEPSVAPSHTPDKPDTDKDGQYWKKCRFNDKPQEPDINSQVHINSACGPSGLQAYTYIGNNRVDPQELKDGTLVKLVCAWNQGNDDGGYMGVEYKNKRYLVLGPDIGFAAMNVTCKRP